MLQGKAGLIEVISIVLWVDWKGNKYQGPFLHGLVCVCLCMCARVHLRACASRGPIKIVSLLHPVTQSATYA